MVINGNNKNILTNSNESTVNVMVCYLTGKSVEKTPLFTAQNP